MLSLPLSGDLWQIKASLSLGFLLTEDEIIPKAKTAAEASNESKLCLPVCLPHLFLGENVSSTPSLSGSLASSAAAVLTD